MKLATNFNVFAEDGGLARGHNTVVLLYVTVLFGVVQHLGVNSLTGLKGRSSNPLAPPILSSDILRSKSIRDYLAEWATAEKGGSIPSRPVNQWL